MYFSSKRGPSEVSMLIFFDISCFSADELMQANISTWYTDSNDSIGRLYSKSDELSIPFIITIDFDTLEDENVTIRERNSMEQIRIPVSIFFIEVLSPIIKYMFLIERKIFHISR